MPNERTTPERLTAYKEIETEQARDARDLAEALFKPKPITKTENHLVALVAETVIKVPRAPRILHVAERPELSPQREPALKLAVAKKQVTSIAVSEYGRIRTLATHGMTIRQVADLYEVAQSEIERIVED